MAAIYLTTDLLFGSRVSATAQRLGIELHTAPSLAALGSVHDCTLVLIDLQLRGLDLPTTVATIRQRFPTARVVAYGPHVQEAALAAATTAGVDQVLTRGQLDHDLERVLGGG